MTYREMDINTTTKNTEISCRNPAHDKSVYIDNIWILLYKIETITY